MMVHEQWLRSKFAVSFLLIMQKKLKCFYIYRKLIGMIFQLNTHELISDAT